MFNSVPHLNDLGVDGSNAKSYVVPNCMRIIYHLFNDLPSSYIFCRVHMHVIMKLGCMHKELWPTSSQRLSRDMGTEHCLDLWGYLYPMVVTDH